MSAKKRKNASPWNLCDVCHSVVLQKDVQTHRESSCPPNTETWTHHFIKDLKLYTTLDIFQVQDEALKHVPSEKRNDFVLISMQALQLANIPIGDPVLISFGKDVQFVKTAWPAGEKKAALLTAALTKEVSDLYLVDQNSQIIVTKCANKIYPAQEIIVESISESNLTLVSQLIPKLQEQSVNNIYCIGNKLICKNYGKKFVFKIKDIIRFSSSESIEDSVNELSIDEKCYLVLQDTKWKLENLLTQEMERKNLLEKIGGLDETIAEVEEIVSVALNESLNVSGFHITRGILVFGPGGTGKTTLIEAIAQKFNTNIIKIEASEIFSKYLGETEKKLQFFFDKAFEISPSIILIDELDTLCPKSSSRSEQEKRIVTALSILMDKLHAENKPVVVLATTSKINHIDKSLRRPGRFGREIEIYVPNPQGRFDIFKKLLKSINQNLTDDEVREISDAAHGFVGADLTSVISKAVLKNFKLNGENGVLSAADLSWALSKVKPSAMREILIEVPNVKWDEIGGQHDLKLKLKQAIEWPLKHGDAFRRLGISPPRGVLMFGPPGCSKTMIAKALATESNLNFISVKGPELFSKWVGESEKAVREVFRRARQAAPSIVFFDELDALGGERSGSGSGSNVQERVLAQLLTELDGVEALGNVTVVGATNRPDRIDPALLRPGRLDRIIYVPLPDKSTRHEIFTIQFRKTPIAEDVKVDELVERTEGCSGAEIVALCHEAALNALEENIEADKVFKRHFNAVLDVLVPRTSKSLLKLYEEYIDARINLGNTKQFS